MKSNKNLPKMNKLNFTFPKLLKIQNKIITPPLRKFKYSTAVLGVFTCTLSTSVHIYTYERERGGEGERGVVGGTG